MLFSIYTIGTPLRMGSKPVSASRSRPLIKGYGTILGRISVFASQGTLAVLYLLPNSPQSHLLNIQIVRQVHGSPFSERFQHRVRNSSLLYDDLSH